MSKWNDKLKIYDEIITKCSRFERKGKTNPYTSANGYMFSALDKTGEIGIRFSTATQEEYIKKYSTTIFKSYNSVMKGYILVSDQMLEDLENVVLLLNESYDYVMTLEPK